MAAVRHLSTVPGACSAGFFAQAAEQRSKNGRGISNAAGYRTARTQERLRRANLYRQQQSKTCGRLSFSRQPGRSGADYWQMALDVNGAKFKLQARESAVSRPRNRGDQDEFVHSCDGL